MGVSALCVAITQVSVWILESAAGMGREMSAVLGTGLAFIILAVVLWIGLPGPPPEGV